MPAISRAFERAHSGTPRSRRASDAGATPSHRPAGQAEPRRGDQNNSPGREPRDTNSHHQLLSPARAAQPTFSPGRSAAQPPDGPTIKLGHPVIKDTHNPQQKRAISCQILPNPDDQGTEGTQISAGAQTNPIPRVTTGPNARGSKQTQSPSRHNKPSPHRHRRTQFLGGSNEPNLSGSKQTQFNAVPDTNPSARPISGWTRHAGLPSWLLGC